MKRGVLYILIGLFSLAVALPTPAGQIIPSTQTQAYLGSNLIEAVTFNTAETVGTINGLTLVIPTASRTTEITTTQSVIFRYQVKNQGNAIDQIKAGFLVANWTGQFYLDASANTVAAFPLSVTAQATQNLFLKLDPVTLVSAGVSVEVSTNAANIVQYTGFNGLDYGGVASVNATDNIVVTADAKGPVLKSITPANGALNVLPTTPVQMVFSDPSGVVTNSVWVGFENINTNNSTTYTVSGSYYVAVLNGVVQPGFQLTTELTPSGDYILNIQPIYGYNNGAEVKIYLEVKDSLGNTTTANPSFFVLAKTSVAKEVSRPVAFPTIFDPGKQSTNFYFKLTTPGDIAVKVYDLSGNQVFADAKYFVDGDNVYKWDGDGTYVNNLSNGVYLFYIMADGKKVIGRGKVVIMREGGASIND